MLPLSSDEWWRRRRRLGKGLFAQTDVSTKNAKLLMEIFCALVAIALFMGACAYSFTWLFRGSSEDEGYLVLTPTSVDSSTTRFSNNFRELADGGHAGMLVVTEDSPSLGEHISGALCSRLHNHGARQMAARANANKRSSEFRSETSYRLFIESSASDGGSSQLSRAHQHAVDIQWIRLRNLPNASIEIENMSSVNVWIERQLARRPRAVVCCSGGQEQCNAVAAMYLMYNKCWRLSHTNDFLSSTVYSRHLSRRYMPALTAYESYLRTTKC
jgi:hypothetical protein